MVLPTNEVARPYSCLVGYIVHEYAVFFGHGVDVNSHLAASSLYLAVACDVSCTVESVLAERVSVVGEQVLCLNAKVIRQVG